MRWSLLCVVSACSFGARSAPVADAPHDVAIDTMPDQAIDGSRFDCIAHWMAHDVRFGAAVPLAEINTAAYERDPWLTADELTIYVSTVRADSLPMGMTNIYTANRSGTADPFGPLTKFVPASPADGGETKISFTSDGKDFAVGTTHTPGKGGVDVWEAGATATTFAPLSEAHFAMVNDAGNQQDPVLSGDGKRIYLAPDTTGQQLLVTASRPSATGNFGAPATLDELDDPVSGSADPTLSPDEKIIVFSSGRAGTMGGGDLWYATRTSVPGTFSAPEQVPDIETAANEGDPHLSSDGCRIYFASDRDAGMDWDLFVTEQLQ